MLCYCDCMEKKLASTVARGMPQGVGAGESSYKADISFNIII